MIANVLLVFIPLIARADSLTRNEAVANALKGAEGQVAVSVIDLGNGSEIVSEKSTVLLKPASVLKIITSAAVLEELGPEFKFKTEFWAAQVPHDSKSILPWVKGSVDSLYLKGSGDPDLTIEALWLAVRRLRRLGVRKIGRIVLDDFLFKGSQERQGQRAYESKASALAFNFNSIMFEVCPTELGKPAQVTIDPSEVRVNLFGSITTAKNSGGYAIDEQINQNNNLAYRLSGKISAQSDCETVYRSVDDPVAFLANTLIGLLEENGIAVSSHRYDHAQTPTNARLLFSNQSKSLRHILDDLNHYSNNFIAQQLLYRLGFSSASSDQVVLDSLGSLDPQVGLSRLEKFLAEIEVPSEEYHLVDGSGLSHENRISARALARTLKWLRSQPELYPEFIASLPSNGTSGTLRKRDFGLPLGRVRAKTGTINGVSSLAGYVSTGSGASFAFVVLQNGVSTKERAVKLEDKIVNAIYSAAHN